MYVLLVVALAVVVVVMVVGGKQLKIYEDGSGGEWTRTLFSFLRVMSVAVSSYISSGNQRQHVMPRGKDKQLRTLYVSCTFPASSSCPLVKSKVVTAGGGRGVEEKVAQPTIAQLSLVI